MHTLQRCESSELKTDFGECDKSAQLSTFVVKVYANVANGHSILFLLLSLHRVESNTCNRRFVWNRTIDRYFARGKGQHCLCRESKCIE